MAKSKSEEGRGPIEHLQAILEKFGQVVMHSQDHIIAGAMARAASMTAMFPIDTIKTRMQASTAELQNPLKFLFSGGNLYGGLGTALIGQTPYGMLVFGSYQIYKEMFADNFPQLGERVRVMMAACLGDITGSIWLCPSEVIKQQLQSGAFSSLGAAVQSATRDSGIAGLYQGYSGLVVRDVPFRVFQMLFYEELRGYYKKNKKRETNDVENLVLGAVAGSFGGVLTTPLDVIKTRLMTQGTQRVYSNAIDCVVKTVQSEGPQGLFRGVGPRVLLIAPSCAIFFVVYEATIRALKSRKSSTQAASLKFSPSGFARRGYAFT